MKRNSRILAVVLAVCLALTMIPGMAFADAAALEICVQNGESGTPQVAKTFTAAELDALTTSGTYSYLYSKSGVSGVVATKVAPLDSILAAAGISDKWVKGSSLKFTCSDGEYTKFFPSYDNVAAGKYTYVAGKPSEVPAGIATCWANETLGDSIDAVEQSAIDTIAAKAVDTSGLRFVYGITEKEYDNAVAKAETGIPMGKRIPFGILKITVVTEGTAASAPTTPAPSTTTTAKPSTPATTAPATAAPAAGKTYTVAKGDSLWKISKKCYGTGFKFMTIYKANKSVIGKNPNKILVGQVLTIPA